MAQLKRFLEKRPAIKIHYDHAGSFRDYSATFAVPGARPVPANLAKVVLDHVRDRTDIDGAALLAQLERFPLISTADHAGLMQFPILFNANLLLSGMMEALAQPYHIVLASGRIPLGNASYPRGFAFAGHKFNFFGDTKTRIPVSLLGESLPVPPPGSLSGLFTNGKSWSELTYNQKKFLERLFGELFQRPVPGFASMPFIDQLAHLNGRLWELFFERSVRGERPRLIYLNTEDVVRELLLGCLADPTSLIHRVLFEPAVRRIYLEEFSEIYGCWGNYGGTHFFWGVGPKTTLHPLRLDPGHSRLVPLSAGNGGTGLELRPDAIISAVAGRRIIPSIFLEMFVLAFVEGYTLLGGFNQVDYLAWMRVQHERCLLRLGEWPLAARCARTTTDGLICGLMPFPQWGSSLDMIWHHNSAGGRFSGNLDGGLGRADVEAMMDTSMKDLVARGVGAMLDVIE